MYLKMHLSVFDKDFPYRPRRGAELWITLYIEWSEFKKYFISALHFRSSRNQEALWDYEFSSSHVRGDQKNVPPSRAEKKNSPGKLSIAFSNTTFLDIIWRFSSTTMHYLCLYDSYCKMNHVSIFGVLLKSYFCRLRQNLT